MIRCCYDDKYDINKDNLPLSIREKKPVTISTKNPRAALKRKQHSEVEKRRRSKINFWIDKIGDQIATGPNNSSGSASESQNNIGKENFQENKNNSSSETSPKDSKNQNPSSNKKSRLSLDYIENKTRLPINSPNRVSKGEILQQTFDYIRKLQSDNKYLLGKLAVVDPNCQKVKVFESYRARIKGVGVNLKFWIFFSSFLPDSVQ